VTTEEALYLVVGVVVGIVFCWLWVRREIDTTFRDP
jgi:hypothetical protein